jgi:hypothetical protein
MMWIVYMNIHMVVRGMWDMPLVVTVHEEVLPWMSSSWSIDKLLYSVLVAGTVMECLHWLASQLAGGWDGGPWWRHGQELVGSLLGTTNVFQYHWWKLWWLFLHVVNEVFMSTQCDPHYTPSLAWQLWAASLTMFAFRPTDESADSVLRWVW